MKATLTDRGYVLHLRPYREHSGLINIFTQQYGRLNAVVHGIHKNSKRSLFQPFVPIICSWKGHGDLKQIKSIEIEAVKPPLIGKQLVWGLYINHAPLEATTPATRGDVIMFVLMEVPMHVHLCLHLRTAALRS